LKALLAHRERRQTQSTELKFAISPRSDSHKASGLALSQQDKGFCGEQIKEQPWSALVV